MPELPPIVDPQPPATNPPGSLAGRMLNIFAAPTEVFDQIRHAAPNLANWLAPAVVLVLVSWLGSWLTLSQPAIQQQMREASEKAIDQQIEKMHLSGAQADQMRQAGEKYGSIGTVISIAVSVLFLAFGTPFLMGLFLWLIGTYAFKAPFPYLKAVELVGLASMISVLEAIVRTLLILVTGNIYASLSPVLFIKDFNMVNPLHSLALFANPLIFWLLSVRAIGLSRFIGTSFLKAAAWVFGIWFAYSSLFWGIGFAVQQLMKRMH